jgi:hypothetical protein
MKSKFTIDIDHAEPEDLDVIRRNIEKILSLETIGDPLKYKDKLDSIVAGLDIKEYDIVRYVWIKTPFINPSPKKIYYKVEDRIVRDFKKPGDVNIIFANFSYTCLFGELIAD